MNQSATKSWRENRSLASLVLCVIVLVSVFGIGTAKAGRVGSKVHQLYTSTMAEDYQMRVQAAEGVVSVGNQADGITQSVLKEAQAALKEAQKAKTPAQQYKANTAMQTKIGFLYEELRAILGEQKGGVLQTQWSEFLSRGNIMGNSAPAYNEAARVAQKKLRGFPASLLAKLAGAQVWQYA